MGDGGVEFQEGLKRRSEFHVVDKQQADGGRQQRYGGVGVELSRSSRGAFRLPVDFLEDVTEVPRVESLQPMVHTHIT